jgi:hypothetical protein
VFGKQIGRNLHDTKLKHLIDERTQMYYADIGVERKVDDINVLSDPPENSWTILYSSLLCSSRYEDSSK